jgi:hypothetical protein
MSGIPNVIGINAQNPTSFVFGQGVTTAPVTVAKTICYSADMNLSLMAHDFAGNPMSTVGGSIGHSYPVSILLTTYWVTITSLPGRNYVFKLDTVNDCGTSWNWDIQSTHTGSFFGSGSITSSQSVSFYDSNTSDNVNFTVSSYVGTFNGNMNIFSIPYSNSPWTFQTFTLNY